MEVNMNETTTDTPKDDGFTIYRVSRRNTRNTGRERYTNKNRRNERMRLLHQVANGTLEPEVAEEALAPASPAPYIAIGLPLILKLVLILRSISLRLNLKKVINPVDKSQIRMNKDGCGILRLKIKPKANTKNTNNKFLNKIE